MKKIYFIHILILDRLMCTKLPKNLYIKINYIENVDT